MQLQQQLLSRVVSRLDEQARLEGDALHGVRVEERQRHRGVVAHRCAEVQLRGVDLQPRHGCGRRACRAQHLDWNGLKVNIARRILQESLSAPAHMLHAQHSAGQQYGVKRRRSDNPLR